MLRTITFGLASFFSTGAFALEDCNRFSTVKEIDQRLACLQSNNVDLQNQINSLKSAPSNAISYDADIVIWADKKCLQADNTDARFPNCTTLTQPPRVVIKRP